MAGNQEEAFNSAETPQQAAKALADYNASMIAAGQKPRDLTS